MSEEVTVRNAHWTAEEDEVLRANSHLGARALAKMTGRSFGATRKRLARLGLLNTALTFPQTEAFREWALDMTDVELSDAVAFWGSEERPQPFSDQLARIFEREQERRRQEELLDDLLASIGCSGPGAAWH